MPFLNILSISNILQVACIYWLLLHSIFLYPRFSTYTTLDSVPEKNSTHVHAKFIHSEDYEHLSSSLLVNIIVDLKSVKDSTHTHECTERMNGWMDENPTVDSFTKCPQHSGPGIPSRFAMWITAIPCYVSHTWQIISVLHVFYILQSTSKMNYQCQYILDCFRQLHWRFFQLWSECHGCFIPVPWQSLWQFTSCSFLQLKQMTWFKYYIPQFLQWDLK